MITPDEMIDWLLELDSSQHQLDDYEIEFIDSIDKRRRQKVELTNRQLDFLTAIYRKANHAR